MCAFGVNEFSCPFDVRRDLRASSVHLVAFVATPGILEPLLASVVRNPCPVPQKAMARSVYCAVAVVLVCLVSIACVKATGTISTEFSEQACANILHELDGDRLRMRLNGTRMTFHAKRPDGATYEAGASLSFQWFEVSEYYLRPSTPTDLYPGCMPSNGPDDIGFDQSTQVLAIRDCSCVITEFERILPGFKEVGYMVNISKCPAPQEGFLGTAYVSVSNETRQELWNNTLPGSTQDHFYYTQMYVNLQFPFILPYSTAFSH